MLLNVILTTKVNQLLQVAPKPVLQTIMSQASEHLKNCTDVGDLKRELRSLCARFGSIMRLDVLMARQGGKRQALCFWRMESAQREEEVMSEFGVGRFGGDLVVIVDLKAREALDKGSESVGRTP